MAKQKRREVAVFASGNGSNFAALANAERRGTLRVRIALLVCDNPHAGVLKRAARARIPSVVVERRDYSSRVRFEAEIIKHLRAYRIRVIALAGFMRMLSPAFVRRYPNRILNIHPAILPAFKGAYAVADAYTYGVKITGVTVHFVDEKMDHGPIILQESLVVSGKESRASLEKKIHRIEHRLYPEALNLLVEGRLQIRGRKVSRR